jgi:hypothetical protein
MPSPKRGNRPNCGISQNEAQVLVGSGEYRAVRPTRPVQVPDRYPPMSVWHEVDAAGARADALREEGREVHFDVDPESGRLVIQLRELDGGVLRELKPADAVAIACGAPA